MKVFALGNSPFSEGRCENQPKFRIPNSEFRIFQNRRFLSMGLTIAQKIIKNHLVSGEMTVGTEIALRIDQTLTQDATGTMAYLEFEAMGIPRVRTESSVAYIDHNTLQFGFENADDHRFIGHVAQ